MYDNDTRVKKYSPNDRDATALKELAERERCPRCGTPLHGITTTGPTEHHAMPCGCSLGSPRPAADGGYVRPSNLTQFQLDCLLAISYIENDPERSSYGLAIKRELEADYKTEVNHGRLYPNLDELADLGLVEISKFDRRTNHYALTKSGRHLLRERAQRVLGAVEDAGSVA